MTHENKGLLNGYIWNIVTALIGAGIFYGVYQTTSANTERRITKVESVVEEHTKAIVEVQTEVKAQYREIISRLDRMKK